MYGKQDFPALQELLYRPPQLKTWAHFYFAMPSPFPTAGGNGSEQEKELPERAAKFFKRLR